MQINEELNELVTKYRENKLAHAYLIETNNMEHCLNDLKELIKILNCSQEYKPNCKECNLCNLIAKNNLPSIKILEPDGNNIKKNQIIELKNEFSTIPIYSKFNIYIIKNAEKLNASSANAMLKFLEEPEKGILGFFLTNNKDIMIDTIKSRCQCLIVKYYSKSILEDLNITEDQFQDYMKTIINYLNVLNSENILNNKKYLLTVYPDKPDIINIFKIIFQLYYNTYLKVLNKEYNEDLLKHYEIKDGFRTITEKLKIITAILNEMSYNVNMELILDKFVIEMRGSNG